MKNQMLGFLKGMLLMIVVLSSHASYSQVAVTNLEIVFIPAGQTEQADPLDSTAATPETYSDSLYNMRFHIHLSEINAADFDEIQLLVGETLGSGSKVNMTISLDSLPQNVTVDYANKIVVVEVSSLYLTPPYYYLVSLIKNNQPVSSFMRQF